VARAELTDLTPHGARHTCASVLREQGADLKDIQEILGHSCLRVTSDLYTHNPASRQAGTLRRMANALRKGPETGDE
jgi:integrase